MPYNHPFVIYNSRNGVLLGALLIIQAAGALLISQYDSTHDTTSGIWLDGAVVAFKTLQVSRCSGVYID